MRTRQNSLRRLPNYFTYSLDFLPFSAAISLGNCTPDSLPPPSPPRFPPSPINYGERERRRRDSRESPPSLFLHLSFSPSLRSRKCTFPTDDDGPTKLSIESLSTIVGSDLSGGREPSPPLSSLLSSSAHCPLSHFLPTPPSTSFDLFGLREHRAALHSISAGQRPHRLLCLSTLARGA